MDTPKKKEVERHEKKESEVVVEQKPMRHTFRYYCDFCTGVAFTSTSRATGPTHLTCSVCFKPLASLNEENYIPL